ncbi:c6 zinc finger domain containing protein [Niveomyces insectorum RCEF 264]|uniref:C6 zinc finger domain containing protein n=1 Tax=Niveomyces insectorum RCEF 264 TaxID=1081102 RepID=A0A167UYQ6_9HYPO|nr:c6 zinc finger domain containing protein [Niveomyces insectorum RCEF 264]
MNMISLDGVSMMDNTAPILTTHSLAPEPVAAASAAFSHPQALGQQQEQQAQPSAPLASLARSTSIPSTASPTQSTYDDGNGQPTGSSPSEGSATTTADNRSLLGPPFTAVPTACLGCRSKHLKCDGQNPCSRCKLSDVECVYIASRRGYKGPRKPNNKRVRSSSSSPPPSMVSLPSGVSGSLPPESCPMLLGAPGMPGPTPASMAVVTSSYASSTASTNGSIASTVSPATTGYAAANTAGVVAFAGAGNPLGTSAATSTTLSAMPASSMSHMHLYRNPFSNTYNNANVAVGNSLAFAAVPPVPTLADRCLDAFYHYFFNGHPFVLPKDVLLSLAKDSSINISHLLAAMRYVGSLYIDAGPARAMFFDEAIRLAYLPTCPKDGFLVQALVMLIVGLDGSCNQERARELLGDCERIAVEIGLNQRGFAAANGRGNPILEESWRRTWWDLFVVDGMVAGVHRMTNFLLFDVHADVALPCEEQQYLAGNIPTPSYIEDFDDQLFTGEEREFSSFAYRIAAARILGRFMRCPPILFADDENMEKIESLLSNWRMHLPASKRDDLTKHCQLDEMMFQAHFINHACSILLHQPHSQLDSSPTRSVTSCAPHSHVPSGDAFNTHTRHTITAACEISKMVTQAVPLLSHTHFFTCVITLSSIVHLSKWALFFIQDEEDLRQQIRLNIGALNKLSEVWKAASTASGQVKGVAQEIYRAKKAQQINPAFWVGFTQEEMINSLNTDEGIMSDFESLLPVSTQ